MWQSLLFWAQPWVLRPWGTGASGLSPHCRSILGVPGWRGRLTKGALLSLGRGLHTDRDMRLLLFFCLAMLGEPTGDILEGAAVLRVWGPGGTEEVGPEGMDTSESTGQRGKVWA